MFLSPIVVQRTMAQAWSGNLLPSRDPGKKCLNSCCSEIPEYYPDPPKPGWFALYTRSQQQDGVGHAPGCIHMTFPLISLNVIIWATPYCKGIWEMSPFQAAIHLIEIQGFFYYKKERMDMRG